MVPQKQRFKLVVVYTVLLICLAAALGVYFVLENREKALNLEEYPHFSRSLQSHIKSSVKTIPRKKKILCFVIDDAGQNLDTLRPFLAFPGPLTVAVLPFLPYSKETAQLAIKAGKDIILHMPMQAVGEQNPGPGTIFVTDSVEQIQNKLQNALNDLPAVNGVNNHMGSAVTARGDLMYPVLKFLNERNLYFFDSLTTRNSAVKAAGMQLGLAIEERDVFLDNEKDRESLEKAIEEGKNISEEKGRAVMIGHVWTNELAQMLMEIYPHLLEEGYTLEDLSQLLRGVDKDDEDDRTGN